MKENTELFLEKKQNGRKGNMKTFSFEKTYYATYIFFWLNFQEYVIRVFTCRALRHCLLLKASDSMSNFLKSVIIFLRKNSELIMKDTKLKFSESANYKVAFQNLSSLMKRKASSEKNFSTILNDICRI